MRKTTRSVILAGTLAVFGFGAAPGTSDAQFVTTYSVPTAAVVAPVYQPAYRPWFTGWWWQRQMRSTAYVPVSTAVTAASPTSCCPTTANSPCATTCFSPCQPRTTCRYVPQTCYRTEYCNVPVTTYRPIVVRDPCTGCCTTTLRPCTTMVRQARRVPYTTYRTVCQTEQCAPAPCPTACCPTDCSTCPTAGAGACPGGACAGGNGEVTSQPTLQPSSATQSLRPTLQPQSSTASPSDERFDEQPMRELDTDYKPSLEPIVDHPGDKSASLSNTPIRRASLEVTPVEPAAQQLDDSGWRAARR